MEPRRRGRPKGYAKSGGRQKGWVNTHVPPVSSSTPKRRKIPAPDTPMRESKPLMPSQCAKTPLEYMLGLMNDPYQPAELRLRSAIAAAPYCHPRFLEVSPKKEEPAYDRQATLAALDAAFSEIDQAVVSSETKQLEYEDDEKEIA